MLRLQDRPSLPLCTQTRTERVLNQGPGLSSPSYSDSALYFPPHRELQTCSQAVQAEIPALLDSHYVELVKFTSPASIFLSPNRKHQTNLEAAIGIKQCHTCKALAVMSDPSLVSILENLLLLF